MTISASFFAFVRIVFSSFFSKASSSRRQSPSQSTARRSLAAAVEHDDRLFCGSPRNRRRGVHRARPRLKRASGRGGAGAAGVAARSSHERADARCAKFLRRRRARHDAARRRNHRRDGDDAALMRPAFNRRSEMLYMSRTDSSSAGRAEGARRQVPRRLPDHVPAGDRRALPVERVLRDQLLQSALRRHQRRHVVRVDLHHELHARRLGTIAALQWAQECVSIRSRVVGGLLAQTLVFTVASAS